METAGGLVEDLARADIRVSGERLHGRESEPLGAQLGVGVATGLSSAKAWVLDEAGQARLHALCIDDHCKQRWPEKVDRRVVTIDVANGGAIYPPAFRVGGYAAPTLAALKSELTQFATDTQFAWCPRPMNSFTAGELAEMRDALEAAFPGRIEACRKE